MMFKTTAKQDQPKTMNIVGHCPKCGAPIYGVSDDGGTPANQYTCSCRNSVKGESTGDKLVKYGRS